MPAESRQNLEFDKKETMSSRTIIKQARRRRRMNTYLWIAALAALTIALIYWELTPLLYVLATLGTTFLLIVVALSDLAHGEKAPGQLAAGGDQPAAFGSDSGAKTPDQSSWGARKLS